MNSIGHYPIIWIYSQMLLILLGIHSNAQQAEPIIKDSKVIFQSSGVEISYQAEEKSYAAPKKETGPYSLREKAILIREWKRLIIERVQVYYESEGKMLLLYDYSGNFLKKTDEFHGGPEVAFLIEPKRILVCDTLQFGSPNTAYLLDLAGDVIKQFKQRIHAFECGNDPSGKLFWIFSRGTKKTKEGEASILPGYKPITVVDIYDAEGKHIDAIEFDKSTIYEYSIKGSIYKIEVPKPDYPG